jgi:hypothetical protein
VADRQMLGDPMRLFIEGKVDAVLGFPPQPQELRLRGIGHVIVNTGQERPWSQYFCCAVAGNREYVRKDPMATKRALRAILKSADLCAGDLGRVARYMADKGFEPRYDIGLVSWFSVKMTAVGVTLRRTRAAPIAAGRVPEGLGASRVALAALAG